VSQQIADVLRNTPVICRKSYIAPCLFKLFDQGKLKPLWDAPGKGRTGLLMRESRLGAVLAAVR
jgi:DNA topoisomerase-1